MNRIKQFPHCDSRILHAPGECEHCDAHPDWQELRQCWHIAFTGKQPVDFDEPRWSTRGPVLPCPADLLRGNTHTKWGGNVAHKPTDNGEATPAWAIALDVAIEQGTSRPVIPAIPQADGNSPAPIDGFCATCRSQNNPNCGVCRSVAESQQGPACEWCKEFGHEMASYMTMKPFTNTKVERQWCADVMACIARAQSKVGG